MRFSKYTDREINNLLDSMIVLADTREKSNSHILDYLSKKEVGHQKQKLEHGDYSCMIPKNEVLGIYRDLYFTDVISIERKGSLEELSSNFTKGRKQIENEFIRARGKLILLVEGATYENIILHQYKTEYKPLSFVATLKTFEARYGIETSFVRKAFAGNFIYMTMRYHVRELLKHGALGKAI